MDFYKLSIKNLLWRKGHSLAALLAFAGVLFVFAVLQSFSQGLVALWQTEGQPQAILYKDGAQSEMLSQLSADDVKVVGSLLQNQWGINQLSAEMLVSVDLEQQDATFSIAQRGLEQSAAEQRGATLLSGRWFTPGSDEIVVGRQLAETVPTLQPGQRIRWGRHSWMVVGIFRHQQPMFDGEVWADLTSLQSAYQRGNSVQSLYFPLAPGMDLTALTNELAEQLSVPVEIQLTDDYFAGQMADFKGFVDSLADALTLLMLLGLVFGGASVLESTFSSRRTQLLTMHAIGFSRLRLAGLLTSEAALLGAISALTGLALAALLLGGQQISTMNQQSQLLVTLQINLQVVLWTLIAGTVTGILSSWLTFSRLSRLRHL